MANNSLSDSIVSSDSNLDNYDSDEIVETKEDMKTANHLFGRIKKITRLLKLKTAFDEFGNKNKISRKSNEIKLKSEKSYEILPIAKKKL